MVVWPESRQGVAVQAVFPVLSRLLFSSVGGDFFPEF